MSETKRATKYKPGTTFIVGGAILAFIGGAGSGVAGNFFSPLMLVAGLVLLIVGIAQKVERRPTPPSS